MKNIIILIISLFIVLFATTSCSKKTKSYLEGKKYINLMEEDLVKILDKIISLDLTVGRQVGLISYNETPLKNYIMNGLTTISTDFKTMGITAAN